MLSYPPALRATTGDKDAVSAARLSPGGAFQLYLNAAPQQGSERLAHWAAFRLHLLHSDDAVSAHQVAAAQGIKFRGGSGSCVMDRYVTRIGGHHFQEIACLVKGHTSASAVVAAGCPVRPDGRNRWTQRSTTSSCSTRRDSPTLPVAADTRYRAAATARIAERAAAG